MFSDTAPVAAASKKKEGSSFSSGLGEFWVEGYDIREKPAIDLCLLDEDEFRDFPLKTRPGRMKAKMPVSGGRTREMAT